VPDMTTHNQRHVEESIYHGVRRRRRCELSIGGRKEGCGEMPLGRLVVAPVACWSRGKGSASFTLSRMIGRPGAQPIEKSVDVPASVVGS
jgi:hypothetical protein